MTWLFNCLLLCYGVLGCAQSHVGRNIQGKGFEGYIFLKDQSISPLTFDDLKERFTPSEQEIAAAEQLIKAQLIKINQPLINQGRNCPIIHKNLDKYKRQYVGYINAQGEKVIWVNFIWGKRRDLLSGLNKGVITVLDGCSYYWNIKVNISKGTLYALQINGVA